jgi:5-methylcytosine-specific restriction endonuclease McrBC GTP-binding regulatory subunit McrB
MKRETLKNILDFLKEKENKKLPKKWFESVKLYKLVQKLENHPDGVQYKHNGDLNLISSTIKKLPNDLYVEGSLGLIDCRQLKKLPNDLYVWINLYLNALDIKEIPNNLYVDGNLFIWNTPLADKYTDEEIYKIVASRGGEIKGDIIR